MLFKNFKGFWFKVNKRV